MIRAGRKRGRSTPPRSPITPTACRRIRAIAGADVGDPAQYIVQKLQLGAVHRITEGNDVVVAVIDSQVDPNQPDLAGRIIDSYDAGCGADAPPDAHGTGMAGAIASHSACSASHRTPRSSRSAHSAARHARSDLGQNHPRPGLCDPARRQDHQHELCRTAAIRRSRRRCRSPARRAS